MLHWLAHWTGLTDASGPIYAFYSGIGSDLMEFAMLATAWHKLNCHVEHCYRLGLHHVEGTPYTTCRKHHPSIGRRITREHIKLVSKKEIKP